MLFKDAVMPQRFLSFDAGVSTERVNLTFDLDPLTFKRKRLNILLQELWRVKKAPDFPSNPLTLYASFDINNNKNRIHSIEL